MSLRNKSRASRSLRSNFQTVCHPAYVFSPSKGTYFYRITPTTIVSNILNDLTKNGIGCDYMYIISNQDGHLIEIWQNGSNETDAHILDIVEGSGVVHFLVLTEEENISFPSLFPETSQMKEPPIGVRLTDGSIVIRQRKSSQSADQFINSIEPHASILSSERKKFSEILGHRSSLLWEPVFSLKYRPPSIPTKEQVLAELDIPSFHADQCFVPLSLTAKLASRVIADRLKKEPLLNFVSLTEPSEEHQNKELLLCITLSDSAQKLKTTVSVNSNQSAEAAISELFKRLEMQGNPLSYNMEESCFILSGTNEVIAGPYSLCNFVVIQQFIESGLPLLELTVTEFAKIRDILADTKFSNLEQMSILSHQHDDYSSELSADDEYDSDKVAPVCPSSLPCLRKIPHYMVQSPYKITVEQVRSPVYPIKVEVSLRIGSTRIGRPISFSLNNMSCGQTITFDSISVCSLPRSSRICFSLAGENFNANGSAALFEVGGNLITDRKILSLFEFDLMPPTPANCPSSKTKVAYFVPHFPAPVFYELPPNPTLLHAEQKPLTSEEFNMIRQLDKMTPFDELDEHQKFFLVDNRWRLIRYGSLLPKFLQAISYGDTLIMSELPLLLEKWAPPKGKMLLELLSSRFQEPLIRQYVVHLLEQWPDADISLFLLQLCQCLQYDATDESPLAHFLLRRAILEPKYLGLQFFWQLRSMSSIPWMEKRVDNLLVAFVAYSDNFNKERYLLSHRLTKIQTMWCQKYSKLKDELPNFRQELQHFTLPPNAQLPSDPKIVVSKYVPEKCKFLDSKKRPLLLTFNLSDPFNTGNISTLLKLDDDLRQDQLVLQLLHVMDYIWKQYGLNMRLKLYNVLPTGSNQGYIEIVPNAITLTDLQKQYAGRFRGAFNKDYILKYLMEANQDVLPQHVLDNFVYSCAGYCVATYILGIGDRHCSNMMIQKDGHFFHIDFGHFLGHFKKKFGIQRETGVFYFSEALAQVMGGQESDVFERFLQISIEAFNCLRKNASVFISLLMLMENTGIAELSSSEDIKWLVDAMHLDLNEQEAGLAWREMTKQVMASSKTTMNDFFHLQMH